MNSKLTKQQIYDIILANLNKAYSDDSNNFKELTLLFEASFGYTVDNRCTYLPKEGMFELWEDTNFN